MEIMDTFLQYALPAIIGFLTAFVTMVLLKIPRGRREDARMDYLISDKQCQKMLKSAREHNEQLMNRIDKLDDKHEGELREIRREYEEKLFTIQNRLQQLEVENAQLKIQIDLLHQK